jgi:hypothetical protein
MASISIIKGVKAQRRSGTTATEKGRRGEGERGRRGELNLRKSAESAGNKQTI